jgi:hypothetical protein
MVDASGNKFLADSRFAEDQDSGIRRRHRINPVKALQKSWA